MPPLSSEDVGRRRVTVVSANGEVLAAGLLIGLARHPHGVLGVSIATDLVADDGPLGDGPSVADDVKPLEEELALAGEHPEYGIDVAAVRAALDEAKAAA